ncbi:hypothetical protein Y11_07161 [Yersinia enterocolitica subsp. palearctica Y11]|uniref:Uncharacterized protein n=1 Tax=Yersinia enterocolitica subsp. palearctica serotype O:3 (strain DSM 13030 / CIP 106945 / Y11) TaxID=930944 RepID=A0A0H3NQH2_YERE1|nr:hypothetical protein Y11_07161 [Yersinia enterocolitica subsp. palearctica Y11]CCO68880.1 hypothetical protein D322_2006 [Yersinia enterocolitica IP 10393]
MHSTTNDAVTPMLPDFTKNSIPVHYPKQHKHGYPIGHK